MPWTKWQILYHKEAAKRLYKIRGEVFELLRRNRTDKSDRTDRTYGMKERKGIKGRRGVSEKEVQKFILKRLKKYGLKTAPQTPIVAFRENTSLVHYYPMAKNCKRLRPGSLILLDIWAALNKRGAPFADVTFMAYKKTQNAKIKSQSHNSKIKKIVNTVFAARNKCLAFIKREVKKGKMPTGAEVDLVARGYINRTYKPDRTNKTYKSYKTSKTKFYKTNIFPHGLGHALGLNHPHGKESSLSPRGDEPLQKNLGYTIEPGIYLPGIGGARSEINFYIDGKNRVVVTTPMQNKIILI